MIIAATCATLLSLLAPGATVVLTSTSPCPPIAISNRTFSPPVTIDATAAVLTNVAINASSGVTWHGGEFSGTNTMSTAFSAGGSNHITVDGITAHNYLRNLIIFGTTSDFRITNNVLSHSGADGIDVAVGWRGVIDGNTCSDPDTTTGSHPDCVQLWSLPGFTPTGDITIINNKASGVMQGFNGFDHGKGGFDHIFAADNTAAVAMSDGMYFTNCRSCVLVHNHFVTPKGAAHWTNFVVTGVSTGSLLAADQTFLDQR